MIIFYTLVTLIFSTSFFCDYTYAFFCLFVLGTAIVTEKENVCLSFRTILCLY